MEEDKKEEIKIVKVTEELIKAKTYEVRGYKVMLDFDLAKIYGYSTKAFNQQVKNNSERFASDFAFKLTKEEVNNLRSKNLTSSWGGSRYLPNAFTEQGIYMLMTILDYGTADERVFLCGASSKDAGARITSIVEDYGTKKYASVMATLLQNPPLVLPK